MKYLVRLARANEGDCLRLVEAIQEARLSTRQLGQPYQTYMSGNDKTRELVVTEPLLVLRVEQQVQMDSSEVSNAEALISDLHAISGLARRAYGRLRRGVSLLAPERERAGRAASGAGRLPGPAAPTGETECSFTRRGRRCSRSGAKERASAGSRGRFGSREGR
jgi:hypothetical protein